MRAFPSLPVSPLSALDGLSLDKIQAFFPLEWSEPLRQARETVTEQDANFFFPAPFLNVSQYEKDRPSAYLECLLSCYPATSLGRGAKIELIFRVVCCFMRWLGEQCNYRCMKPCVEILACGVLPVLKPAQEPARNWGLSGFLAVPMLAAGGAERCILAEVQYVCPWKSGSCSSSRPGYFGPRQAASCRERQRAAVTGGERSPSLLQFLWPQVLLEEPWWRCHGSHRRITLCFQTPSDLPRGAAAVSAGLACPVLKRPLPNRGGMCCGVAVTEARSPRS